MRLIDADALKKFIDFGHLRNPNEKAYSENDIREMIDEAPTIDLVRCRECRYLKHDADYQWCGMIGVGCEKVDDDFCSYGELK